MRRESLLESLCCRKAGQQVAGDVEAALIGQALLSLPRRTDEWPPRRGDHCGQETRRVHALEQDTQDEHAPQAWGQRHARECLAQRQHALPEGMHSGSPRALVPSWSRGDRPQLNELTQRRLDGGGCRRVRRASQEVTHLALHGKHLEARRGELAALHLRGGAPGCGLELRAREEPVAAAVAHAPRAALALDGRGLGDPDGLERGEAAHGVVGELPHQPRVHHHQNVVDRDAALRDVRAQDDLRLPLRRALEDLLLVLLRERGVQGEHPEARRLRRLLQPLHHGLDLRPAWQEGEDRAGLALLVEDAALLRLGAEDQVQEQAGAEVEQRVPVLEAAPPQACCAALQGLRVPSLVTLLRVIDLSVTLRGLTLLLRFGGLLFGLEHPARTLLLGEKLARQVLKVPADVLLHSRGLLGLVLLILGIILPVLIIVVVVVTLLVLIAILAILALFALVILLLILVLLPRSGLT
mmetsp:Transcript_8826/g.26057  ORF Transcript_8826/g.26057 Transcript_8826/m.26057 type:complete len:468 (+) Transcript_8826:1129-2532(+)